MTSLISAMDPHITNITNITYITNEELKVEVIP